MFDPTFGIRMIQNIFDSEINVNGIAINLTPPWLLKRLDFSILAPTTKQVDQVYPTVFQSKFNEHLSPYDGYTRIFTSCWI